MTKLTPCATTVAATEVSNSAPYQGHKAGPTPTVSERSILKEVGFSVEMEVSYNSRRQNQTGFPVKYPCPSDKTKKGNSNAARIPKESIFETVVGDVVRASP